MNIEFVFNSVDCAIVIFCFLVLESVFFWSCHGIVYSTCYHFLIELSVGKIQLVPLLNCLSYDNIKNANGILFLLFFSNHLKSFCFRYKSNCSCGVNFVVVRCQSDLLLHADKILIFNIVC